MSFQEGPAEKRPRMGMEAFHVHVSGLGIGAQTVHREHVRAERVSQSHEGKGDGMETSTSNPHRSQGPPSRLQWPSSGQIAYKESKPDATIGDPTYIPNVHQQTREQLYRGRQPRVPWSQEESQDYNESGYVVGARLQNWQERAWNTHWEHDSIGSPTHRGGGWRGGQPFARIPSGGYPSHPIRPPSGRPGLPRRRHPMDFDNMRELVYMDRDGIQWQSLQQRGFYDEGDHCGHDRPNTGYNNSQTSGLDIAPLQVVMPNMVGSYPMAASGEMLVAAVGVEAPNPFLVPSPHHVSNNESFKSEMARTRDSAHPEDNTHTFEAAKSSSSGGKQRRNVQHMYEAEEADRKARGLKPYVIECNSLGEPDECGRRGSRFFEVLKALCMVFLDVSIIKVMAQDAIDYASLREEVDSEFEFTGYPISDHGFKKVVAKCMKAERSRLHKLYISKPDRECPLRDQPHVWERLKTYWHSAEFEKVSKLGTSDFILSCSFNYAISLFAGITTNVMRVRMVFHTQCDTLH